MKLLLDTHALVWALSDPDRLSARARTAITRGNAHVYASMVNAWELSILVGLGRVQLSVPLETIFTEGIAALRVRLLPIQVNHVVAVAALPQHHRDPFDRLLVATAMTEKLALVSCDETLAQYEVDIVW